MMQLQVEYPIYGRSVVSVREMVGGNEEGWGG